MNRLLPALLLILLTSCQTRWPEEIREAREWMTALKPAIDAVERDLDLGAELRAADSIQATRPVTPLSRARRNDLVATYHFFHTHDYMAALKSNDSALACFPTAKEQEHYPRTYVGFLLFAGELSYRTGHYQAANEYYFRAKQLSDRLLPVCERSAYTYQVAMVLYRQKNYEGSMRYFREAFDNQELCPDQTAARVLQQQEILSNIGLCLFHRDRPREALEWFDRSARYVAAHRDSLEPRFLRKIEGVLAGNKAKAWLQLREPEKAETLFREALARTAVPDGEAEYAQDIRLDLSRLLFDRGNTDAAQTELQLLRRDLDTLSNPDTEKGWHELMGRLAHDNGNVSAELWHYKRYELLEDSLTDAEKRMLAADLQRQLSENELQLQRTLLNETNRMNTVYLFLLILGVSLAASIIWLLLRGARRQKKNLAEVTALNSRIRRQQEALEHETRRRQQLVMEAVIAAQEAERSAIGLELHDNINQVLTTVKLHHEMARDGIGDSIAILTRSAQYLQDCIDEIRSLSKRLATPTLGKIGLCDSIHELVQSINQTGKLEVHLRCDLTAHPAVRQSVHLAAYRIIQEALNNVIKHSGATEAHVELSVQPDGSLVVGVEDNGRGLRTGATASGIGITNMRTRAESLGGRFEIEPNREGGCALRVSLPGACTPSASLS